MSSPSWWQEAIPFVLIFVFYIAPIIWVLSSRRSHGGAKLGWFIVALMFSWLGLAAFLIVTQAPRRDAETHNKDEDLPRIEPRL
jgi:hypothetical protein